MKTQESLKQDVQHALDDIKTIRDRVRVRLHLASLEAKQAWEQLEPRLADLERDAKKAGQASKAALVKALDELKGIDAKIEKH